MPLYDLCRVCKRVPVPEPGGICENCEKKQQATTKDDRVLEKQETKPRTWRDCWGVGKRK